MERTDTVTKITAGLLFAALLCYIGVYVARSLSDPMQTASVIEATVYDSASSHGLAVREELVLESGRRHIDITAQEGKRVSSGSTVAFCYDSDEGLARAARIRELELEILGVETLLGTIDSAENLFVREGSLRAALTDLSSAVSRHELDDLDSCIQRLRSLVFDSGSRDVSAGELQELEAELSRLRGAGQNAGTAVTAPESGIFSGIIDGYEHLSLKSVSGKSPDELRGLINGRRPGQSDVGKLITSSSWYYAAIMSAGDAVRLEEASVSLDFGKYHPEPIKARVLDIGEAEGGECVVIFACSTALADTIAMRQVSAEVLFDEYSGLRVPLKAVHEDEEKGEEGETLYFVYTITAMKVEKKSVEIVYEAEDFALVVPSGRTAMLRPGNEIVVTAKEVFDGMVLGQAGRVIIKREDVTSRYAYRG